MPKKLVSIAFLGIFCAFLDLYPIVGPVEEDYSMLDPVLFVAAIYYGPFPLLCMTLFTALLLTSVHQDKWKIQLFNNAQFALAAYMRLLTYQSFGGHVGSLDLNNILSYAGYWIVYLLINELSVFGYILIRFGIKEWISRTKALLEYQLYLFYVISIGIGLLMTIVLQSVGIIGGFIFIAALWLLIVILRKYCSLYDYLRDLSIKDELTGLYNHRYFHEKLEELCSAENRLSLLLMDLDCFKVYNDIYGHLKGDKLLKDLTATLLKAQTLPEHDPSSS